MLLTADRPARFRGSGAPQAIEQVGIFSNYARCMDVEKSVAEIGDLHAYRANGSSDTMLTVRDAAERLGIALPEFYRLIQDGKMPAINIAGRWRVSQIYLDRVVAPQLSGEPQTMIRLRDGGGSPEIESRLCRAIQNGKPIHINACFEEPLAADVDNVTGIRFEDEPAYKDHMVEVIDGQGQALLGVFLESTDGLAVMLGNLRGAEARGLEDFLKRLGAPVLAEAGSGLREKLPGLAVREIPADVQKVLRIGGVPSARFWRDLEKRDDIRVFSVTRGRFPGLARGTEVAGLVDWRKIDGVPVGYSGTIEETELAGEPRWLRFLSEAIPDGSLVFLGNSLPIREWNQAATFEDRGLRCFSCRGANGIDGALSTFLGLSEGQEESWAIVGDLTALYDLGAPWILDKLSAGKRRIVVINNGGGRIFSKLPALAGLADNERRAIENDHGVSLENWAAMWGMGYRRVEREEDFVVGGEDAVVIEIVVTHG